MAIDPRRAARVPLLASAGRDSGRGNLVGAQPWLTPADYASPRALFDALDRPLRLARRLGWLGERTVVALPEYVGTWLAAAGGPAPVYRARTVAQALGWLAALHAPAFALALLRSRSADRLTEALFRARADAMARGYQRVFGRLAAAHRVTLAAGSLVLPGARVVEGAVRAGAGPLQNVAALYGPDGQAHPRLARKVFPIDAEAFLAPGALDELPVYETPAGRLGVAVCADSWSPEVYAALRGRGAELLAVPSYLAPDGVWRELWQGYNGRAAPPDVRAGDVGVISEGEAWARYALAGRAEAAGFRAGVNPFLRGRLWDLGADGRSVAVGGGRAAWAPERDGAALVNVWLEG